MISRIPSSQLIIGSTGDPPAAPPSSSTASLPPPSTSRPIPSESVTKEDRAKLEEPWGRTCPQSRTPMRPYAVDQVICGGDTGRGGDDGRELLRRRVLALRRRFEGAMPLRFWEGDGSMDAFVLGGMASPPPRLVARAILA
ncbi:hypothetical protein B0H16DRAFT_1702439 [Mycena metata]|uniref:Uncharacterized protein n=1 Tax=Mycena metata TaxID=1033252 RepID=A0AAD7H6U2_9AGAR|nr:hypothetical protein B0H16DRAFT_1702439 [Mycena metata]